MYKGGLAMNAVYSTTYNSHFAPHIRSMLELKATLGRYYKNLAFNLQSFDRFVCCNYPNESNLTQKLAEGWCSDGESATGSGYRMNVMRDFGKYLVSVGINAFVLPSSWHPITRQNFPIYLLNNRYFIRFTDRNPSPCPMIMSHVL